MLLLMGCVSCRTAVPVPPAWCWGQAGTGGLLLGAEPAGEGPGVLWGSSAGGWAVACHPLGGLSPLQELYGEGLRPCSFWEWGSPLLQ